MPRVRTPPESTAASAFADQFDTNDARAGYDYQDEPSQKTVNMTTIEPLATMIKPYRVIVPIAHTKDIANNE